MTQAARRRRTELTDEQRVVVRLERGPARVLAGAGSGKTYTMTELISKKIWDSTNEYAETEGVVPERILAITFTVKAAEEMRERLRGRVGDAASKLTVSNFHRLAFEIARENAVALGIDPDAPVLRRPRAWLTVLDDLGSDDLELRRLDLSTPATVAENTLQLLSEARNERIDLERLERRTRRDLAHPSGTPETRKLFERRLDLITLAQRFERTRARRGQLQYHDMIEAAIRVLEDDVLGAPYRGRYDLVVVDEFQDTNPAQLRLVELLTRADAGDDLSKVVVIGDDLQSIFNFQGAAIRNIQRFEERAGLSINEATYRLKKNFRSATRILDLANYVAEAVHPEESPDPVKLLDPRDDAPAGEIETFISPTDVAEAKEIADRITRRVQGGASVGECAVLIRKWSQAGAVLSALSERGLPCEVVRGGELLGSDEVRYLTDVLRIFSNLDAEAVARMLTRDPYRLSDGALEAVFSSPEGYGSALRSPERVPGLSEEVVRRIGRLRRILENLETEHARVVTLEEFVGKAIEVSGLGREVSSVPTRAVRDSARHALEAFREVAGEFGRVEHLDDFLRYVRVSAESRLTESSAAPEVEGDAVVLTSVHGAKGLEFDHVFVPGLSKGLFPDSVKITDPLTRPQTVPPSLKDNAAGALSRAYDDLDAEGVTAALRLEAAEEEGRLFYVAITRARRSLTLSRAHFYRENKDRKAAGQFWELLHGAPASCEISVPDETEGPEANPALKNTEHWEKPDGDGWVLEATRGARGDEADLARELGVEDYADTLHVLREDVRAIPRVERPDFVLPPPERHSPSSLMEFEVCPRRYYYRNIFPVVSAVESGQESRDYGTAWHEWIEAGAAGDPPVYPQEWDPADPPKTLQRPEPTDLTADAFRERPYGRRASTYPLHAGEIPPEAGPARMVEVPFSVEVDGSEIRGRIDAVFVDDDGTVHIVDWKSGKRDPNAYRDRLQLPLYALAAIRLWGVDPTRIRLAYVFRDGRSVDIPFDRRAAESTEARIRTQLEAIRSGAYPPKWSKAGCSSYCPVFGIGIDGCPRDEAERDRAMEGGPSGTPSHTPE